MDLSVREARDSATINRLEACRAAFAAYQLANGGRLPHDIRDLAGHLHASREPDPFRWTAGSGRGRIDLVDGVPRLVEEAGGAAAGRDARGRSYASY
jgi:hypothetical protein